MLSTHNLTNSARGLRRAHTEQGDPMKFFGSAAIALISTAAVASQVLAQPAAQKTSTTVEHQFIAAERLLRVSWTGEGGSWPKEMHVEAVLGADPAGHRRDVPPLPLAEGTNGRKYEYTLSQDLSNPKQLRYWFPGSTVVNVVDVEAPLRTHKRLTELEINNLVDPGEIRLNGLIARGERLYAHFTTDEVSRLELVLQTCNHELEECADSAERWSNKTSKQGNSTDKAHFAEFDFPLGAKNIRFAVTPILSNGNRLDTRYITKLIDGSAAVVPLRRESKIDVTAPKVVPNSRTGAVEVVVTTTQRTFATVTVSESDKEKVLVRRNSSAKGFRPQELRQDFPSIVNTEKSSTTHRYEWTGLKPGFYVVDVNLWDEHGTSLGEGYPDLPSPHQFEIATYTPLDFGSEIRIVTSPTQGMRFSWTATKKPAGARAVFRYGTTSSAFGRIVSAPADVKLEGDSVDVKIPASEVQKIIDFRKEDSEADPVFDVFMWEHSDPPTADTNGDGIPDNALRRSFSLRTDLPSPEEVESLPKDDKGKQALRKILEIYEGRDSSNRAKLEWDDIAIAVLGLFV